MIENSIEKSEDAMITFVKYCNIPEEKKNLT